MEPSTVADLFTLVIAGGLVTVVVALFVEPLRTRLVAAALPVTAAIASGATAGSLYFSEIADFIPCKLCWFQRIAMYPLAALLVLAAVWRDRAIFRYAVPIAIVGGAISAYHVWIQWFPEQSNFCEFDNPCSAKWVEAFDMVTIPQMAGLSFAMIATIGAMSLLASRSTGESSEPL